MGGDYEQGLDVHEIPWTISVFGSLSNSIAVMWLNTSSPPATQVQWAHTMIPPALATTQAKDVVDYTLCLKGFSYYMYKM